MLASTRITEELLSSLKSSASTSEMSTLGCQFCTSQVPEPEDILFFSVYFKFHLRKSLSLIHVTLIQQWGAHPPSDPSNTFTSIILARHTPGDSHTIPWCEASNLGAIPMAINRPARPNITTCEAGSAWISLMKEMLEMDKQNERNYIRNHM